MGMRRILCALVLVIACMQQYPLAQKALENVPPQYITDEVETFVCSQAPPSNVAHDTLMFVDQVHDIKQHTSPRTGYKWEVVDGSYDEGIVEHLSTKHTELLEIPPLQAFSTHQFRGVSIGSTSVTFKTVPPAYLEHSPENALVVNIVVKQFFPEPPDTVIDDEVDQYLFLTGHESLL